MKNRISLTIAFMSMIVTANQAHARAIDDVRKVIDNYKNGIHNIVIYQFGKNFPIPQDGSSDLTTENGWLVVVNNAKIAGSLRDGFSGLVSGLAGKYTNCAFKEKAYASDGTRQRWDTMTAQQAIAFLKKEKQGPYILWNANYFDVRPQKSGETWQSTGCSSPLGVQVDRHPDGVTDNHLSEYLDGLPYYVSKDGDDKSALQTMVIKDVYTPDAADYKYNIDFKMVDNDKLNGDAAKALMDIYHSDHWYFTAFSGTALVPERKGVDPSGEGPDSGGRATTRIGFGYNFNKDQIYIFHGGSYDKGLTRDNLRALFKSLGVESALELDGGGSASLAVKKDKVSWGGLKQSFVGTSSCSDTEYVCVPVTQPSGRPRPVPVWAYINFPEKDFSVIPAGK